MTRPTAAFAAIIAITVSLAAACSGGSEEEVREAEETTVAEETREARAEDQAQADQAEVQAEDQAEDQEEVPTNTEEVVGDDSNSGWDPVALSETVDPSLRPVPDEAPAAAVARCEETTDPNTCVALALDGRERLRAQERQRLIDAHRALGNEDRMLDHMEAFLADYPRDRRGNRIRMRLREAGRI